MNVTFVVLYNLRNSGGKKRWVVSQLRLYGSSIYI